MPFPSAGRSSSYFSERSSARSSVAREMSSTLSPVTASLDAGSEYYTSAKYRVRSYYTRNYNRYGYY